MCNFLSVFSVNSPSARRNPKRQVHTRVTDTEYYKTVNRLFKRNRSFVPNDVLNEQPNVAEFDQDSQKHVKLNTIYFEPFLS